MGRRAVDTRTREVVALKKIKLHREVEREGRGAFPPAGGAMIAVHAKRRAGFSLEVIRWGRFN